jgi:hypothetical protein
MESFSLPLRNPVCVTPGLTVSAWGLSVPVDNCNREDRDHIYRSD